MPSTLPVFFVKVLSHPAVALVLNVTCQTVFSSCVSPEFMRWLELAPTRIDKVCGHTSSLAQHACHSRIASQSRFAEKSSLPSLPSSPSSPSSLVHSFSFFSLQRRHYSCSLQSIFLFLITLLLFFSFYFFTHFLLTRLLACTLARLLVCSFTGLLLFLLLLLFFTFYLHFYPFTR